MGCNEAFAFLNFASVSIVSVFVTLSPLAKTLGVDLSRTVAVGDYNNDIEMLRAAALGYAVANAHPDVKAAADRVTKRTCAEGAIAEIIEDLDREIISNR